MKRVVVCQRFLPHYRIPFYQHLARKQPASTYEVHLFYSLIMGDVPPQVWATRLFALKKRLQLGELTETFVFAPTLFFHLLLFRPAIVVVEDIAGLPNSLAAALYCQLFKKPYLVWGLGKVPDKSPSKLRRWLAPLIHFLYSRATAFICYSHHAKSIYEEYGHPTFVAHNSCLSRPGDSELETIRGVISKKYHYVKLILVSIGTLSKQKRYDVLLKAISELSSENIELHLIGNGTEKIELEALARELKISKQVIFHGAIYTDTEKFEVFSKSHIGILPGRGGLAIQEMMSHGIPVMSGVADGTEKDLIRHGENGYLFEGFLTAKDITNTVIQFTQLEIENKKEMAFNALDTVVNHFNVEKMVESFQNALNQSGKSL